MKIKIGNKTFEVLKEELDGNPEEIAIDFKGTIRTLEEETTFTENIKSISQTAGAEKALRTKADELGLEIQGSKRNIDDVFNAYAKKVLEDAKIEPAEQLKKIKQTLEEKESALQNALSKITEKEVEFKTYKNKSILDKELDSYIPDNTILPKDDIKTILKTKLKFDIDDSGNVFVLDASGNVMKDATTANPLGANEVVSGFFKDNQTYLKPVEGGAGGSDSTNKGTKKTIDKFIEEQQAQGIKVNSPEFNEAYAKQVELGLVEVD